MVWDVTVPNSHEPSQFGIVSSTHNPMMHSDMEPNAQEPPESIKSQFNQNKVGKAKLEFYETKY